MERYTPRCAAAWQDEMDKLDRNFIRDVRSSLDFERLRDLARAMKKVAKPSKSKRRKLNIDMAKDWLQHAACNGPINLTHEKQYAAQVGIHGHLRTWRRLARQLQIQVGRPQHGNTPRTSFGSESY
jgi:hypothetical protein